MNVDSVYHLFKCFVTLIGTLLYQIPGENSINFANV